MSPTVIQKLSYKRYAVVLRETLEQVHAIVFCNADGAPLYINHCDGKSSTVDIAPYLQLLNATRDASPSPFETYSIGNNLVACDMLISAPQNIPLGRLIVTLHESARGLKNRATTQAAMSAIVDCLVDEYRILTDLGTLSDDLDARHEELHLIYETSNLLETIQDAHSGLTKLVSKCVEYMNVDMVVLYLPEKKMTIPRYNTRTPLDNPDKVTAQLTSTLYAWTEKAGKSLLSNEPNESVRVEAGIRMDYKLLSCPVVDIRGKLEGLIVCVNTRDRRDFSRNDQHIIEVISRTAAAIIHANYDSLTGLMNRESFTWQAERLLDYARQTGWNHCVLYVDINQLQVVNDTLGHLAGDALIVHVGRMLCGQVKQSDFVGRLGGGIFGVLLQNCPGNVGEQVAERIRANISVDRFTWQDRDFSISANIGMSGMFAENDSGAASIYAAELACDAAKETGRNRLKIFNDGNIEMLRRKDQMHWVNRIQRALKDNLFIVYCQPIIPFTPISGMYHYEILLRLQNEGEGILSPGSFMTAAERYELMPAIDRWVIKETLRQVRNHRSLFTCTDIELSINLSGQSLCDDDLLSYIDNLVKDSGIPPQTIGFEVTESAAVKHIATATALIGALRKRGHKISLDDFGTGLSSFSYLKTLPVDVLKIDGSFVKEMAHDPLSYEMVGAIHRIGRVMGLKTVAEFVENDAIATCLKKLEVDYGQGFGLGKPRPLSDQLVDLEQATQSQARKSNFLK
ncbi:MAG: PAS/PAC sensor(s)-containing diguanylate cyclase/phosphodiesterase [Gammaproteobacteria bacterium]|nr:MAG: PAS/PAC sensor(s)-containing diguanylate cyclase/phosphodiesterase [Gammaproteobacteria bacterium]TND01456.1 MAG: PAS/PAC sensor(s)-containing diguanylate cyclase/phosphodiesterase [Gammaproteobacteria bacterium]